MTTARAADTTLAASRRLDRRLLLLLPVAIVVLDQLTKAVISDWLGPGAGAHRWEMAGRALAFEYLENRGAAFGILPEQTGLLAALSILISGFGLVVMWREARHHPLTAIAIGMIVGGAVGNIVDRLRLGYVVDFVAVGTWPKFNLADSMISIGVVVLIASSINDERVHKNHTEEELNA